MSETATLPPESELKPANQLAAANKMRVAGESAEYRTARTALLAEEIGLRRQIQRVAEHRRALPPGPVAKDYRFLDEQGREIGLLDLFGEHGALFTYFWMFGPERERPCPMCTSFVGSLDIPAPDIEQRVALAILGRSRAKASWRSTGERPTIASAMRCSMSGRGMSSEPTNEVHIGQGRSRSGPNIQK